MSKINSVIDELVNMSYDDLVNLQKKGNREQLENTVKFLAKQANQRLSRLGKSAIGSMSPSYISRTKEAVNPETGEVTTEVIKFSGKVKGVSSNQLMHNLSKLKSFLKNKTSTVPGYKEVREHLATRLKTKKLFRNPKQNVEQMRENERQYWRIYQKLHDDYGGVISSLGSERIQAMLSKVSEHYISKGINTDDEILEAMRNYVDSAYTADVYGDDIEDIENAFFTAVEKNDLENYRKGIIKFGNL